MQQKTKFEKIFITASLTTIFVAVGLLVFGIMQVIPMNRFLIDLLIILFILAFGAIACLPALRMLNVNKKDIYAYVLLGLTGFVCLMWIICVFVAHGLIDSILEETVDTAGLSNALGFTKVCIFLTIVTAFTTTVITNLYNFKKNMFAFQIVMYVSNFISYLWLSIVVLSLKIVEDEIVFTAGWLLDSKFFATLFVLAVVFSFLSAGILKRINKRRDREVLENDMRMNVTAGTQQNTEVQSTPETQAKPNNDNDPWAKE